MLLRRTGPGAARSAGDEKASVPITAVLARWNRAPRFERGARPCLERWGRPWRGLGRRGDAGRRRRAAWWRRDAGRRRVARRWRGVARRWRGLARRLLGPTRLRGWALLVPVGTTATRTHIRTPFTRRRRSWNPHRRCTSSSHAHSTGTSARARRAITLTSASAREGGCRWPRGRARRLSRRDRRAGQEVQGTGARSSSLSRG